jgi:hypothetical protein
MTAGTHGFFKGKLQRFGSQLEVENASEYRLIRGSGRGGYIPEDKIPPEKLEQIRAFGQAGLDDITSIYAERLPGVQVPLPSAVKVEAAEFEQAFGRGNTNAAPAGIDQRELYLNPRANFWDNPEQITSQLNRKGMWSSGAKYHVIRHEVGHIAYEDALRSRFPSVQSVMGDAEFGGIIKEDIRVLLNPEDKNFNPGAAMNKIDDAFVTGNLQDLIGGFGAGEAEIARSVSLRAEAGPTELVAEVFAGTLAGKGYNQNVLELYQRFMGPELPRVKGR